MLKYGLYEQVISKDIRKEIDSLADSSILSTAPIDESEASVVLAKYLTAAVAKGLDNIRDSDGKLDSQVSLVNKILALIKSETRQESFDGMSVDERAEQLLALYSRKNSIYAVDARRGISRPQTSIAQSSLFTGARHEPSMFTELKNEIASCDRIDMLVSFIKWSGLRLIIDDLRAFTQNGGCLRIITTSYMGATDAKAVEELSLLPNTEIRVSYDTEQTRLHAKAYVFYRGTGFTTAYIGSSNLSRAAISSGLEWNVKVTEQDLPYTLRKIGATFESYWNSSDFEEYRQDQRERLEFALKAERHSAGDENQPYIFDISPYSYQKEILEKLEAERQVYGRSRNLIVAATGTGKTVISAFDYRRFRRENPGRLCRLLFIAHREEILKQSLACFRGVLRDGNFGDLFVGTYRPESIDHLFMSIQTFNSQNWDSATSADFYDYIIVDEFHHSAAPVYQRLLSYYKPKIFLGLTATPERMDGQDVTEYFDHHISAEIRLPEAIDRELLCPFQYFGVTDDVDLSGLKWSRGGYDRAQLSNIYTLNPAIAERRCEMIILSLQKYLTDLGEVRGLGFCVSVAHAEFMSGYFNARGIKSICLTGASPEEERGRAKKMLEDRAVSFIFVVDIYNEGVDIPAVNTILFLRPTESLTIFLQQLGRGLRRAEGKECLTVLDFIGQANKKYNFADKFTALLEITTRNLQKEIKDGFSSLPRGCFIQLERKARDYILDNIKASFDSRNGLVSRLASFEEDSGLKLTLANFLDYHHLGPHAIYAKESFSRLCVMAGTAGDFSEPLEDVLRSAFPRLCDIDSRRWLEFMLKSLDSPESLDLTALSGAETRMLRMFQFTVWQKSAEDCGFSDQAEGLRRIKNCPVLCGELRQLLSYNRDHLDFIDVPADLGFDCPLDLYCTYTRDQILTAMDYMSPRDVREGVKWLPEKKADVFFVTLNKSDRDYSPTTLYNDYSISETLFHWQSQSTTSDNSSTGQRYINNQKLGTKILFFVRENKSSGGAAMPYTFLGLADYIKHDGSRPMNVVFKLHRPIPAKFMKKTNKLVAV